MIDLSKYRPCVGIMLVNRAGLVFIGRRKKQRRAALGHEWQMPQGGIDPGEDPFAAARRELHEETNVSSISLLAEAPDWYTYEVPKEFAKASWKGRYCGQKQKWFAFRFEGVDSEIDISAPAEGAHAEFDAWRWERMEKLPELVIPFKRSVYERVIATFRHLGA
ncbi:MAG TPA: RNA pyrophosphohydrolase [Methylovirgula sp.]|nr:RNA pyrophosphohydrolase [Methylovirgula sp.]